MSETDLKKSLFEQHLPGCTPLSPCKNCKIVQYLRKELGAERFGEFLETMERIEEPEWHPHWNTPVSQLDISLRARNALENARIDTLGQLTERTEVELFRLPNIGRKATKELKAALASYDLTLKTPGS